MLIRTAGWSVSGDKKRKSGSISNVIGYKQSMVLLLHGLELLVLTVLGDGQTQGSRSARDVVLALLGFGDGEKRVLRPALELEL